MSMLAMKYDIKDIWIQIYMDTSIIIDIFWSRIKRFLLSLMWRFYVHLTMAVAGQNTEFHFRSMISL